MLTTEPASQLPVVDEYATFLRSPSGTALLSTIAQFYSQTADLPPEVLRALPLNPLNDPSAARLLQPSEHAQWLGLCLDFGRELFAIQHKLFELQNQAQTAKITNLTRLQRSLVSDRVVAVSKDSTVGLARFISSMLSAMDNLLDSRPTLPAESLVRP